MKRYAYSRPRSHSVDSNHGIVQTVIDRLGRVYGGLPLVAVDTSSMGGIFDWLIWLGPLCIAVEIKNLEGHRLRFSDKEAKFMELCTGPRAVVLEEQDVIDLIAYWYEPALILADTIILRDKELRIDDPRFSDNRSHRHEANPL